MGIRLANIMESSGAAGANSEKFLNKISANAPDCFLRDFA
ncbi:hypothetical protein L579_4415 [Pantoea sp. AS-PWVM4]|nr:hypothetical protein L579_4415 [Pantoea sp. AS-PWVM4]